MPKNKTNPNVLYDQALTYLLKVNDMLEHHIKNCVFDLECKKSRQGRKDSLTINTHHLIISKATQEIDALEGVFLSALKQWADTGYGQEI